MKIKKSVITLLSLSFISSAAFAQVANPTGATTLTLGGAAYYFANKRHIEDTGIPNVALAYNFNERWAGEILFGVINTNQSKNTGNKGVHGFIALFDGIYRFAPYNIFQPYLSAGVGYLGLKPNSNDESYHQANINAGVGAQAFVGDAIALRAEVKDLYTIVGGKNDVMLNLGVSFLFGGECRNITTYKT